MDSYEGNQQDPLSIHKYLYCHDDPIDGKDPTGHAVYFVERRFGWDETVATWNSGFGHGYLLFTSTSDSGNDDPFETGREIVDSFSFHPYRFKYSSGDSQVPSRVWELDPLDTHPTTLHRTTCVTANPAAQDVLVKFIHNWIKAAPVGYELGNRKSDPEYPQNVVGDTEHVKAPPLGVYYSLYEQNCVWWATIMLKQSCIPVKDGVYTTIAAYNHGVGAAAKVISYDRDASDVRTMGNKRFTLPTVLDIDFPGLTP